jgi:hypothetical protein
VHAHIRPRHHTNYELVPTQEYYERDIWKTIEEVILEAQWAVPVSLTFLSALKKLNTEPSIGASHQIAVQLAKQFQRRRFLEISQSETRIACGGHFCKWIITKCAISIENLP